MKRIFLFALFVSMASVWGIGNPEMPALPDDDEDGIEVREITILPIPGPKSVAPIRIWYFNKLKMISLCTNSPQGLLVVALEDGSGNLMLQQTVDGDQSAIKVLLPILQAGYYLLTIQSSTYLIMGKLEVH